MSFLPCHCRGHRRDRNSVPLGIAANRVALDVSQHAKRIVNATFRSHFPRVLLRFVWQAQYF